MATPAKFLLPTLWLMLLLVCTGVDAASGSATVSGVTAKPASKAEVPVSITNLVTNPGLESGSQDWATFDSRGQGVIRQGPAHSGSFSIGLGGLDSVANFAYQDVAIPADTSQAFVQFWYFIDSQESPIDTRQFDKTTVVLGDPGNNAVLANLVTLSNADRTNGAWVQSQQFDVSAFKGRTVRLTFSSLSDAWKPTTFLFDDIQLASVITVPPTVPGAPMTVSATAGNGQAVVSFAPPASDGGSAITGYLVTSNPAGGVDTSAGSPATTHTVTNLANGTRYTFTVTALNAVGSSQVSAPSNMVMPGVPAPVAAFKATPVAGAPFTLKFTDQSQSASSWLWAFGDGGTSTEQNPSHSYTGRGTFTVTLTTTNAGGSSTVTKRVKNFGDISGIIMMFTD